MAITFRQVAYTQVTTDNPDPGEPAGTQQNDLLLGVAFGNRTAIAKPTGWTELYTGSTPAGGGSDQMFFEVAYIVRGASAAATLWGYTGSASKFTEVHIVGYIGVDTASPIDAQSATGATGDTSGHPNPDPGSVTAVTTDAMAICGGMTWQGSLTGGWSAPAGYTRRSDNTVGNSIVIAEKQLSASGAENPAAFSNGGAGGTEHMYWDGFTITLKTAAAGAAGYTLIAN